MDSSVELDLTSVDDGDDGAEMNADPIEDDSRGVGEDETALSYDHEVSSPLWLPHYGAAEQLSRLRHYPPTLAASPPQQHAAHADIVMTGATPSVVGADATPLPLLSALNVPDMSISQPHIVNASPSTTTSADFNDALLDIDPMMCSLLWRTLEASITETSGSSYLTQNRTMGDSISFADYISKNSISLPTYAQETITTLSSQPSAEQGQTANGNRRLSGTATPSRRASGIQRAGRQVLSGEQPHDSSTATTLDSEPAQMAAQMKHDLHSMMGHLEAPIEPVKGLATACLWLCRRHFLPTSVLNITQESRKSLEDGFALVMNFIALGSLWHHEEVGRKWGADIWAFTLRVVWSRGMRNVQDESTVSMLMSILLSGHSYVLRSSDPAVHRLGRRAWLYCHLLHDHYYNSQKTQLVDGSEEDIEQQLAKPEYRAELRAHPALLQKAWQHWRDVESQIRVAWGVCIYDSQQATWLDLRPSLQADVRSQHPEPASERLFQARHAHDWLDLYEVDTPKRRHITVILKLLLRPFPCSSDKITWSSSQQAGYNIIESLYSSWVLDKAVLGKTSEYWDTSMNSTDTGLLRSVHALANWRLFWEAARRENGQEDRYCLLIRWHCIHMAFCLNEVDVASYARRQPSDDSSAFAAKVDDEVLQIPRQVCSTEVEQFFSSSRGRRALWHAGQICAELSKLPRVASTPIHVAQAAYESLLLLAVFARIAAKRQASRQQQKRAFELLTAQAEVNATDAWSDVGLAGFLSHDDVQSSVPPDSSSNDWGKSSNSTARRWILEGETQDATLVGLSLPRCSMALRDLARDLEESRLMWCLAADYKRLIDRTISMT